MEAEQINIEFEQEQPKHGKRVYVYLGMLVAAIFSLFIVKVQWQNHALVTHVLVEGNSILSKEEIVRLMKLPPHVSMYNLDLTMLQRNIQANTFVKSVIIQRDAPSQLRVAIEERKPAAMLMANEIFYIDEDGVVLPYTASSETYDIPVISGADSAAQIKTGKKIFNEEIQEALEIIAASKMSGETLYHAISEIRLRKGHDIVCYSFESGIPIIFGRGDVAKKIVKLDAFLQKFSQGNETQGVQYIDIRYDDQVVVSRKNS